MSLVKSAQKILLLAGAGCIAYFLLLDEPSRKKFEGAAASVFENVKVILEKVESLQGVTDDSYDLERTRAVIRNQWESIGY